LALKGLPADRIFLILDSNIIPLKQPLKKNKTLLFLIPAIGWFALSACTRHADYFTYIDNQSTHDITVLFMGSAARYYGDSIFISAGVRKEINFYTAPKPTKEYTCDPGIGFSEYQVTVGGGLNLIKSMSNGDNWFCSSTPGYTEWVLEFIISDSDLN
jgi:hypothetical protein